MTNLGSVQPPFMMLMQNCIFGCIRPQVQSAAFDLKDPYFHVSILPCHRPFLRFAFEGRAYQYKVLPFGLSLLPRFFTKVAEAALVPLREQGVRILTYLDDWLVLAQSQDQLCEHRDLVLSHLSQLGLRVNWEKSKLLPTQRIYFLSMELDSVDQIARLTQERAKSVLNRLNTFKCSMAVPLNQFQRLLGHMGLRRRSQLAPLTGSESHRSAAKPSPHGETFRLFGECPWNRYPGMLWFTRMPPPPAGGPCSTGLQCRGFGRVPNCTGTSTA